MRGLTEAEVLVGVSVQAKGRGRSVDANLNLVPFIDLLSVCIIFLIATAVWIDLSALPVDQGLDTIAPPSSSPPLPPLTIHLSASGVWVGRDVTEGRTFSAMGDRYDWPSVSLALDADRRTHEGERQVVIVTDDGVSYSHMIAALDLTRAHGYEQPLLGGGPGQPNEP